MKSGVKKAIKAVGGVTAMSRVIGNSRNRISRQAIYGWINKGMIPPERCIEVERISGVHRHWLNESIYPEPPVHRSPPWQGPTSSTAEAE
jgi:DNA-binding transcriptional regulator YdaS (Cro superfamily)